MQFLLSLIMHLAKHPDKTISVSIFDTCYLLFSFLSIFISITTFFNVLTLILKQEEEIEKITLFIVLNRLNCCNKSLFIYFLYFSFLYGGRRRRRRWSYELNQKIKCDDEATKTTSVDEKNALKIYKEKACPLQR